MEIFNYVHLERGYVPFDREILNDVGTTFNDYLAGQWVLLSAAQINFRNANPHASVREVLAMQLDPPPPEPTLPELKKQAVDQVKQASVNKLNDMFPQLDINAAALGLVDETAAMTLFADYDSAADKVKKVLDKALSDIDVAVNKGGIDAAVALFNSSLASI